MQAIRCVCPSCDTALKVTRTVGGAVRCPRCGSRVSTDAPAPKVVTAVREPRRVDREPEDLPPASNNNMPLLIALVAGGGLLLIAVLAVVGVVAVGAMRSSETPVVQTTAPNPNPLPRQIEQPFQPNPNPNPPFNPNPNPNPNPPVGGEPVWGASLTDDQQSRVNAAIDKGVDFLKKALDGRAADQFTTRLGGVALGTLTLLSCGVAENDPVVRKGIEKIRAEALDSHETYDVSLCILALDRLNDASDKPLIRTLALRLMAWQLADGGWGYRQGWSLSGDDQTKLLGLLQKRDGGDAGRTAPDNGAIGGGRTNPGAIGERVDAPGGGGLTLAQPKPPSSNPPPAPGRQRPPRGGMPFGQPGSVPGGGVDNLPVATFTPGKAVNGAGSDNSNTQFAILAVWAAQKHGVPVRQTMRMVESRFKNSQNGDGSWGYRPPGPMFADSMTCAGLIGMAVGKGADRAEAAKAGKDAQIDRAISYLGQRVGKQPVGRLGSARLNMNAHGDLYFLWTLERMAVIYDTKEIDGKEWYGWGAKYIVEHQGADGAWRDRHAGLADTSFALLFLKRANVAQDLTTQIRDLNLLGRVK